MGVGEHNVYNRMNLIGVIKTKMYVLLRKSERYTKLDMLYFASGSFWQTFGQVTSGILSLLLVLLFANVLSKETYGLYRYVLALGGLLNIFTLTGMNQAITQAVAAGKEGVFRTAVRYQLKWNSILMLASLALVGYYAWNGNWPVALSLLILSACTPLTNALNTFGAYLAGKRQFRLDNIFGTLTTLVYVLGTAAAVMLSGQFLWLIAAYALTTLGANALFYYLTVRKFKPPAASLSEAAGTLAYGRELTWINLIGPVVAQLDSIILNHFWGPVELAVYSLATAIPNRAVPFMKDWVEIGFPKAAAKTAEELDRVLYQRIFLGLAGGTVIALAYAGTVPLVFTYLLPKYLDAVVFAQLLGIQFIFAMPVRYLGTLLAAQRMSRTMFISNGIQAVTRIGLYIVLGIWGGILGLVIAQAIASFNALVVNLLAWKLAQRRSKM